MLKTIGLVANLDKPGVEYLIRDIARWLEDRGCQALLDERTALATNLENLGHPREQLIAGSDCIMVLGGDGTLLGCARMVASSGVPIAGVNLGRLGFLTEVDMHELYPALERMLAGKCIIEERMMLTAWVYRHGQEVKEISGLNDIVISKGAFARLIVLKTVVNREVVGDYPADGLIIATPTGSTAYSLSAGGPLVVPNLDLMLVTPICPHTLWARPLVISADSIVEVTLLSRQGEVMLTVDGQYGVRLRTGDRVRVQRAPYKAKFLKLTSRNFFNILWSKLKEGDRPSE
ncbi:MAG: NAD(+)/NADH kinase [Bacillota bacterium]